MAVPPGTIIPFAGPKNFIEDVNGSMKDEWLLCDGRELNAKTDTKYYNLYKTIGTAWGNGNATAGSFNLPDLRGMFLRGVDHIHIKTYSDGSDVIKDPRDRKRNERDLPLSIENTAYKIEVGTLQKDSTRRPRYDSPFKTNDPGNHVHPTAIACRGGADLETKPEGLAKKMWTDSQGGGHHVHIITDGGDDETCPINAYVNWIIKY